MKNYPSRRFAARFAACLCAFAASPHARFAGAQEAPHDASANDAMRAGTTRAGVHVADAAEVARVLAGFAPDENTFRNMPYPPLQDRPPFPIRIEVAPPQKVAAPSQENPGKNAKAKIAATKIEITSQAEIAQPAETVQGAARRLKLALPLARGRLIIWKSQRRLEVWNDKTLVKTFRVALGANPLGAKQTQGDSRTPEGEFFLCTRNASTSAFHIFLGLSYPAMPDATRAVQSKKISPREFQIIQNRLAARSAPLWRTRLGGWVGIHGGSNGAFAAGQSKKRGRADWTAGCIALTDKEIEEIYAATKLGTPVSIRP